MGCNCLFTDFICKCVPYDDFIHILTSLTPGASYTAIITDKFANEYAIEIVAESDGSLQIPIAGLPDGMMSQYGGRLLIQIESPDRCGALDFPLAKMYDGIELEIRGGTREKNTVGCEVVCSGGGTTTMLVPFTDAATVELDWATYSEAMGNNPVIQVYHQTSPGVYQLASVSIEQIRSNGTLTDVEIDNGGIATGYVLLS